MDRDATEEPCRSVVCGVRCGRSEEVVFCVRAMRLDRALTACHAAKELLITASAGDHDRSCGVSNAEVQSAEPGEGTLGGRRRG